MRSSMVSQNPTITNTSETLIMRVRHEVAPVEWSRRKAALRLVSKSLFPPLPASSATTGFEAERKSPRANQAKRGATGKGKTGRVNVSESLLTLRDQSSVGFWLTKTTQRANGMRSSLGAYEWAHLFSWVCHGHHGPGAERTPTPVASHRSGTWKSR